MEIGCLNYRLPTTGLVGDESLFRLSEFAFQDPDCIDPLCNHGVYKAVIEKRHKVLDATEMSLPTTDAIYPVNFLCGDV